MFTGRVIPHVPRVPLRHPLRPLVVVWTAPLYVRVERDHLAEGQRLRRRPAALPETRESRRGLITEKNAASRAKALWEAVAAETAARDHPVAASIRERVVRGQDLAAAITLMDAEYGIQVSVGWSTADPRYAGGVVLVDEHGTPAAVFNPDPERVRGQAFLLLAGMLLLFPTYLGQRMFEFATARLKWTPAGGYRMDFLAGRPCACAAPKLVVRIAGEEHLAEPGSEPNSGPALYRARCMACGGLYEQPWRRTRVGCA
ncbi:hypothetical protein ACL02O_23615 [Micromonospora sp. MS34]|uniref:hypothetical protein n=1 Tax=Micromonospora sp. MS34 TaxID=3385971 RepID=UPI0039A02065